MDIDQAIDLVGITYVLLKFVPDLIIIYLGSLINFQIYNLSVKQSFFFFKVHQDLKRIKKRK